MKIIAHRGNMYGSKKKFENEPSYLDTTIKSGFDVEIDLWIIKNELFLGHDKPQYKIDISWLAERQDKLWIHCKNTDALRYMLSTNFNYFWHETDTYTLTSKGYVWAYPNNFELNDRSILVMPTNPYLVKRNTLGICTDIAIFWRDQNF